jgi:hypothetical protein
MPEPQDRFQELLDRLKKILYKNRDRQGVATNVLTLPHLCSLILSGGDFHVPRT